MRLHHKCEPIVYTICLSFNLKKLQRVKTQEFKYKSFLVTNIDSNYYYLVAIHILKDLMLSSLKVWNFLATANLATSLMTIYGKMGMVITVNEALGLGSDS